MRAVTDFRIYEGCKNYVFKSFDGGGAVGGALCYHNETWLGTTTALRRCISSHDVADDDCVHKKIGLLCVDSQYELQHQFPPRRWMHQKRYL